MKYLLIVLLLIATPAAAQDNDDSKKFEKTADVISWVTAISNIAINTIDTIKDDDTKCQLARQSISNGLTLGTIEILKRVFHKKRPDGSDYKSFPSMHTGLAAANQKWNWKVALSFTISTASGRILAEKHDWIDVLAGSGIGFGSSALANQLVNSCKGN